MSIGSISSSSGNSYPATTVRGNAPNTSAPAPQPTDSDGDHDGSTPTTDSADQQQLDVRA